MTSRFLRRALSGRSARWSAALALLVLVGSRPAAAAPVRILAPTGGETLAAGQLVEVRWDGLPADVDEMELLLDVDQSAALRLRVTPQLGATTRTYLWRVPNLPGRNATLRLRWGREGIEAEGEPSAPFAILADPDAPFEGIRFRLGEWWLADPFSTFELPRSGVGPELSDPVERPQPATASVVNEVAPPGGAGRHQRAPSQALRPGISDASQAEVEARCPLTIPLRP